MLQEFAEAEALQFGAMKELQAKGVQFKNWSPEIMAALEAKWQEVVAEESAKSPNFKKVWASYSEFRKNYKIWSDYGYLK